MKIITMVFILSFVISCNNSFYVLQKNSPVPGLFQADPKESDMSVNVTRENEKVVKSFTFIDKTGREMIVNEAVKDEATGEMISLLHLNEIVVTAKSRNISEREGVIRLDFIVRIPPELQNSQWQINILPVLTRGKDTLHFSRIVLSGKEFKKEQEKGYKRYEKFIRSIIPDSADFLEVFTDLPTLTLFLERNLPSSKVLSGISNDTLSTVFGLTENKIVSYYIKQWLIERNKKKKADKERMFEKYVKTPYLPGSRLDSVIKNIDGDFLYHYTQEIQTNANTSRLLLCLNGGIRDISGLSYVLKPSDTLVYNVSSMISFIDTTKRFIKKIIERRITSSATAFIHFRTGKSDIADSLSGNAVELSRIKNILKDLLSNDLYVLDSLILTASSSPDGLLTQNKLLSKSRSSAIAKFCKNYINSLTIDRESLIIQNLIISRSIPEDWEGLRFLIISNHVLKEKEKLLKCFDISDLDKREKYLSGFSNDSRYIKENLYPMLRRVEFSFHLHRKGMVKDTIHSTVEDSLYTKGLKYLNERKYAQALSILYDYRDFNTAVAHISLGHDRSAQEILLTCADSAYKIYLLAILSARKGEEEQAVKYFLKAKEMNINMAYRGTLDPEISSIIKKYNLNNDLFK